jgi:hypothetical protein
MMMMMMMMMMIISPSGSSEEDRGVYRNVHTVYKPRDATVTVNGGWCSFNSSEEEAENVV